MATVVVTIKDHDEGVELSFDFDPELEVDPNDPAASEKKMTLAQQIAVGLMTTGNRLGGEQRIKAVYKDSEGGPTHTVDVPDAIRKRPQG